MSGTDPSSIKAAIEAREIEKIAEEPKEHAYLIIYDLKPHANRDTLQEVMIGLKAVQLTTTTYGFLTNLQPSEIKECFQDVITRDCERCWIVRASSPFDGIGEDVSHAWLWAMPDYVD